MPYITLLGQKSSHNKIPVINSNQALVTIQGITVNVYGGAVAQHEIWDEDHWKSRCPILVNHQQSFVTIQNKPIFIIGDSADCGTILIPAGKPPKSMQQIVQIS